MLHVQKTHTERILFYDNIRYLMVFLVVVLHVACGYSHYTTWWAVNDDNSIVFDYVLRVLDIFLMPTLFFIAGFFALPSLHKKGTWRFINTKLIRLGIPWLVGVILLGPVRTYIHEYSRHFQDVNLGELFMINLNGALSLQTGFINDIYQFNHIHFWFISLLLIMFILFSLLHYGKEKLFACSCTATLPEKATNKSILTVLLLASIITAMWTLFMHTLFTKGLGREPWIVIASVIQFQPTRVGLYAVCFGLGVFAFYKKWFIDGNTPGNFAFWAIFSMVLWGLQEMVLASLISHFSMKMAVMHVLLRTFLVFSVLLTFISFGGRYWQSGSKVNQLLAKNSYTTYLIHLPIVFLVQLLLYKWWDVSIHIKFITGCVAALILTYVISEYFVRRYPRISIAGMVGLLAVLTTVLSPG